MVVGVAGYYGFKNAGDEAILEAIARELRARGHEVLALSGDPRRTAGEHGIRAAHRLNPLALLGADLWLLGGGGLLQDATSALSLTYYLSVLRMARLFRRRVVVFNQSLGPLSPGGERRVQRALKGVPVILRDQDSLAYAERLGIPAALGADPALLLSPPPVRREEDLVVVIPRAGVAGEALKNLYITANHLVHEGRQVLVLLLQPGYDDAVMNTFYLHRIEKTSDPRRVLYLVAQAGYVISMRLHGLVLAAAAGTPFAGVAYDPKVAAFAKEAGAYWQELPGDPIKLSKSAMYGRVPDWEKVAALKERARRSFDLALGETAPVKRTHGRG
ncbi:polysaccharide pyruvyl transferase CsaB [Thermus thermamylovorans]|uniref:Polysaccharide pyruvyl transferase CsaB n=1 Tax=Thermus thermamylovorans TaxID=2509362 RepID=A0A4Q9B613_9DEIN|nr:polysaccharide pyruvyl transferase CsaB [Thermus thermamylovorans]TBH21489.1 polysaccharide pyruvyl transferase CsaB [Thermus thermamylovorans]